VVPFFSRTGPFAGELICAIYGFSSAAQLSSSPDLASSLQHSQPNDLNRNHVVPQQRRTILRSSIRHQRGAARSSIVVRFCDQGQTARRACHRVKQPVGDCWRFLASWKADRRPSGQRKAYHCAAIHRRPRRRQLRRHPQRFALRGSRREPFVGHNQCPAKFSLHGQRRCARSGETRNRLWIHEPERLSCHVQQRSTHTSRSKPRRPCGSPGPAAVAIAHTPAANC